MYFINYREDLYRVGKNYENGKGGVQQNLVKAAKAYKLSAERGFAPAQFCYGTCLENGYGVSEDLKNAVDYYKLAAAQGNQDAINALSRLEKRTSKKAEDIALFKLGLKFQNGTDGNEHNPQKAVEIFTKLAGKGHAKPQCELGLCYEKGIGCRYRPGQCRTLLQTLR